MTQSPDPDPNQPGGFRPDLTPEQCAAINVQASRIAQADQFWAAGQSALNDFIDWVRAREDHIAEAAGGNTDASVVFDWLKGYIQTAEAMGGKQAHDMTVGMCAVAITKLVRAPRTNDILAQLDKEINHDDDH